ncbi:arylsulfatase [Draconibacterium orientale]|uniref:arylsulfatase n=1 Tax=Draconibacterium orientale TaxID=1168034 RepID=UPI0029C63C2E|nr:arylsulfatase [Draconibacterium orientale]
MTRTNIFILIICFVQIGYNGFAQKEEQPNIIFILADDMSYRDLSCYGQQRYQTPNIDAMAASGIRFTQAYAAAPECAPSRCSLLTGKHTGHSSVRTNSSARGQDNLLDEDITIAEVLKGVGYNTAFTGKWGVGLPGTEGVPYKQGFDYAFGFYDQTRAHTYIPYYLRENDKKVEYPENMGFEMARRYDYKDNKAQNTYDGNGKLYIEELKDPTGFTYSENEIQKAAFSFLNKNLPEKTGKPFFLYYATQLPHGPVITDDLGEMKNYPEVNQLSREWGAMVIKLDNFVGELISYLKETGEFDNTIIFFASDNGYSMCGYTERGNGPDWPDDPWLKNKGPFTGGKFSVLEGGCRVPFFVSSPEKFNPAVISEPVWLPDFFPTACELAGVNSEKLKLDGVSLLPALEGDLDEFEGHDFLYFSKGREQAVRMGPWKAYRKNPNSKTELYLVEEDTYTERNLAILYPEKVKEAEEIMKREHEPHEWYWNPWETATEYNAKKQKAIETGNVLPAFRPNGMEKLPWEK